VEGFAGQYPVNHFDASNFNHPVPIVRIKSSGFRVENYFSHAVFDIGLFSLLCKACPQFFDYFS
jgi:hypothetical protein